MTLKAKTFTAITSFALVPLVFSVSVFIIHTHVDLLNESRQQRFTISRWLEAEFYPAIYRKKLMDFRIPEGIEVSIINNKGIVEYSNIPFISRGSYFSMILPRYYESLRGKDSKSLTESFIVDGEKWHLFLVYEKIPAELEKKKFVILVKVLQFSLFIIAAGSILGSFFVGSVLKSVKNLENGVREIADGNFDFTMKAGGSDEFVKLTESFDRMRQALKEEQERKSRFLMAVSHDLKTPLTGIKGYLEAINDGMASDPEILEKYLGIISDKTFVLEERISDLISFAVMERGEWELRKKKIRLRPFLDSLSIVYREDCEIMGKVFSYENLIPEHHEVLCDPVLFERALENHFTNSLRYTFSGAEISLRCFMDKGVPVIEMADNGEGISGKDIAHVFEPFFRGSPSRKEPGMGLGLTTAKTIYAIHGWEVSAFSGKGNGTVFRITLKNPV